MKIILILVAASWGVLWHAACMQDGYSDTYVENLVVDQHRDLQLAAMRHEVGRTAGQQAGRQAGL